MSCCGLDSGRGQLESVSIAVDVVRSWCCRNRRRSDGCRRGTRQGCLLRFRRVGLGSSDGQRVRGEGRCWQVGGLCMVELECRPLRRRFGSRIPDGGVFRGR